MKLFNKIFALLIIAVMVLSLAACGNKEDKVSKPNDTSKVTSSEEDKTTESKPEENKDTTSKEEEKTEEKNEESKPTVTPEPKPEPVKKTPQQLIVGKWKGKNDIAPLLADEGFPLDGPLEIDLDTEFTASGSIIERADKQQMMSAMRTILTNAINDLLIENNITKEEFETQIGMSTDEYIEYYVDYIQDFCTMTAEYKFENNKMVVKFDGAEEITETYSYEFINDDKVRIYNDSEETIYTRVK